MAYCPHCGTANKPNSKFCKNCGAVLSAPHEIRCAICGTLNRAEDGFCSHCGARLGAARPIPVETADTLAPFKPLPQAPASTPPVATATIVESSAPAIPAADNQTPPPSNSGNLYAETDSAGSPISPQEPQAVSPATDSPPIPVSAKPTTTSKPLPEWVRRVRPFETEDSPDASSAPSPLKEESRPAASEDLYSTNSPLQTAPASPTDSASALSQETKPATQDEQPAAPAPARPEELPEWLKRMQGMQPNVSGETTESSSVPLPNSLADESDDEGLPEWLRQLEAMHPEAAEAGKRRTWLERVRGNRPTNGDIRPSDNG